MVSRVDDTNGFGPALLGSSNSFPEDSFAATASIALSISRQQITSDIGRARWPTRRDGKNPRSPAILALLVRHYRQNL
jgi:hypothetical protein